MTRCTCCLSSVYATDIDPPELVRDRDCPMHGEEPGVEDVEALEPEERDALEDRMRAMRERS
ncbi:MAG: hypothetical protein ACREUG_17040 [Steroidobacteraceae bacterium]